MAELIYVTKTIIPTGLLCSEPTNHKEGYWMSLQRFRICYLSMALYNETKYIFNDSTGKEVVTQGMRGGETGTIEEWKKNKKMEWMKENQWNTQATNGGQAEGRMDTEPVSGGPNSGGSQFFY